MTDPHITHLPFDGRSRIHVRLADGSKRIIDHVQKRIQLHLPLRHDHVPRGAQREAIVLRDAAHHVHRDHVECPKHVLDLRIALPFLLLLREAAAPLLLRQVSHEKLDVEVLDGILVHVAAISSRSHVLDLHTDSMKFQEVRPLRAGARRQLLWMRAIEHPCVRVAAAGDVLRVARDASMAGHPLVVVGIVDRALGYDLARVPIKGGLAGDTEHLAAVSHGRAVGQLEAVVSVDSPSVIRAAAH